VWFPEKTEIRLDSVYCSKCGFMTYSPRPTDENVADKYNYLKQVETDIDGQTGHDSYSMQLDSARAKRIYNQCIGHFGDKKITVLDYGGGNGKLMASFVGKGHECYLMDYYDHPIQGVTKICDDINSCKTGHTFDLIVCSHVLEHVSDISGLVMSLKKRLKPKGIIYAEVPQEIWAGLRIDADPVTHINFFTKNSFMSLFLANGFNILESKQMISNYGKSYMEVIWVIAQFGDGNRSSILEADVEPMLYPSRIYSIRKIYNMLINPKLKELGKRYLNKNL